MNTNDPKIASIEPTISLQLTEVECEEVAQLLDVAVKTLGLKAAGPALKYVGRIQNCVQALRAPAKA